MSSVAESLFLELTRRFEAPPRRVFDAWLTREWGEWLPPRDAHCKVLALDARVGGRFEIQMTMGDGRNISITGDYREISRPEKLVLSWTPSYSNHETLITVTFRPDGTGTLMTLKQTGFAEAQQRDGYKSGWSGSGGSFDKLSSYLAKGE